MNDIIEHQQHELVPQTAANVKAQVQAIQEVLAAVMKKDVHYGVIPGTKKQTLYKAGAEVLLRTFRISVDPEIEDMSSADEIRYRVTLRGIANAEMKLGQISGYVVGAGVGEASTNEERYKWKRCGDQEFEATPEDRRRKKWSWRWGERQGEKIEYEEKQIRTEPADLANTVLKMAKKRAQVDLCLTALSASDVFDQDLEDMDHEPPQTHNPKAGSSAPRSTGHDEGGQGRATDKQIGLIKAKADQAGIRDVDVWAHAGVSDWDQIKFRQVNELLDWIKEVNG